MCFQVPGDVLSDLQAANVIPDPLKDTNFIGNPVWNNAEWTYSTTFTYAAQGDANDDDDVLLVRRFSAWLCSLCVCFC